MKHEIVENVLLTTYVTSASEVTTLWRYRSLIIITLLLFLAPQYEIPEGKILKTKQVRPQRRLLNGENTVEGDRITPLESH